MRAVSEVHARMHGLLMAGSWLVPALICMYQDCIDCMRVGWAVQKLLLCSCFMRDYVERVGIEGGFCTSIHFEDLLL